jgi:hypothetical protein
VTRAPTRPATLALVDDAQLAWALDTVAWMADQLILIRQEHSIQMTQSDDFQSSLDANTAATDAAASAITAEIRQLRDALAQLSTSQPPTQAQLDQLNASTSKLQAATDDLRSDDTTTGTPQTGGAAPTA